MLAMGAGSAWAATAPDPDSSGDIIVVTGSPFSLKPDQTDIQPDQGMNTAADAAALADMVPGGALVNNGAVSGQFTYRGMFGPRLEVRIEGQKQTAGCPNLMDPTLSNAPLSLISRLEVARGIAPVRFGPGIGGSVAAVLKRMPFGDNADMQPGVDVEAAYRSADNSYRAGGMAGLANDRTALSLLANHEHGDDLHTPKGVIADSGHERTVLGVGLEQKIGGDQTIRVEYRNAKINDAGTPPLPMDLIVSDVDSFGVHWRFEHGPWAAKAQAGYDHVFHIMDNHSLRPVASPQKTRMTRAHARAWTYKFSLAHTAGPGTFTLGMDGDTDDHSVAITSPVLSGFYVANFPHTERHRLGVYAQWAGDFSDRLRGNVGIRLDRVQSDAGDAAASAMLPPPVQMLKTAYNAVDHARNDTTADLVLRLQYQLNDHMQLRFGAGQKSRAPNYVERYGWLPNRSASGLADGHIYVGDMNLKPEVSREVEAGVDWSIGNAYARPAVWLRNVDDYITGVPVASPGLPNQMAITMLAGMNGDANPLVFANAPARLYGADMDVGMRFNVNWRLDGVASIQHGERRDIDDGLYRLSPAHAALSLTRSSSKWSVSLDGHFVATQDNVSVLNNETRTPGHVRFDLHGQLRVAEGVSLTAGVENLFDTLYEEHLAGINRVTGSAIPMGEKIPGAGRGVFLRLNIKTGRGMK